MATILQNVWTEKALVSLTPLEDTTASKDIPFQAKTGTIDIDQGEKDVEGIPTVGGARVVKFTPETDTVVTLECYHQDVGSGDLSAATLGAGFEDMLHAEDTTQPLAISSTTQRTPYRMAIMWTEDTSVTNACAAVTGMNKAKRYTFATGYITAVKPSFTDGVLKFSVTFKVTPFDAAGASQILRESTDGTASMAALQSYVRTPATGVITKW